MSLQWPLVPSIGKDEKINVIDTPWYADFVGKQVSALRVADAAVLVASATGAVVGGLNRPRLHIAGMSSEDGIATIEVSMPQVEAQQYSTQLCALTHGCGTITMEVDHCGEVPANLVPKILAAHEAENAANGPV